MSDAASSSPQASAAERDLFVSMLARLDAQLDRDLAGTAPRPVQSDPRSAPSDSDPAPTLPERPPAVPPPLPQPLPRQPSQPPGARGTKADEPRGARPTRRRFVVFALVSAACVGAVISFGMSLSALPRQASHPASPAPLQAAPPSAVAAPQAASTAPLAPVAADAASSASSASPAVAPPSAAGASCTGARLALALCDVGKP